MAKTRSKAIGIETFVKTWIEIVGGGGTAQDVADHFNAEDDGTRSAASMSSRASDIRSGVPCKDDEGKVIEVAIPLPEAARGGGGGRKHANADMLHSLRALALEHGQDPDEAVEEPLAESTPDEVVVS